MHNGGEDNLYSSQTVSDISPQGKTGTAKANILSKSRERMGTNNVGTFKDTGVALVS